MKRTLSLLLAVFLFATQPASSQDLNKKFDDFKRRYIDSLWKFYPEWASQVGYHQYDAVLHIPNTAQRQKELDFQRRMLDSLKNYPVASLHPLNQIDQQLITNQCNYLTWQINDYRAWEWDPREYNLIGTVAYLLNEPFKPLNARLMSIGMKLKNTPLISGRRKRT